jgi:hypothetical protein
MRQQLDRKRKLSSVRWRAVWTHSSRSTKRGIQLCDESGVPHGLEDDSGSDDAVLNEAYTPTTYSSEGGNAPERDIRARERSHR